MRDIILTVFRLALFLVTPALYLLTVAAMVTIALLSLMWFVQILECLCGQ